MAVGELTDRVLLGTLPLGRRPHRRLGRWRNGAIGVVACLMALTGCSSGGGGGDGPIPTVIIIPPGDVAKGQSVQLFAMVVDAGPGVVWSMQSGAAYGTVTPTGVFTAPLTVPDGPAIVRATSRDDSRGTATTSIRVVVGADALTVWEKQNQSVSPSGAIANTFSGGQRSVAISGSTVYLVWNDDHAGDQDIYLAVSQDRGATFGSPIRVNDVTSQAQSAPSVAVDASGRAVIAWIDAQNDPTPGYDVYVAGATLVASGTVTIGPNQRVTTNGPVCYPEVDLTNPKSPCDASVALAVSAAGDAYVAWTDRSNGIDTDVLLTKGVRLNSGGLFGFTPPTPVHAYLASDQIRPSVAIDTDENVVVAWMDARSGGQAIYWRRGRFLANGDVTWVTQDMGVDAQTVGDQVSPSVAVDQTGLAYVAWSQQVGVSQERRKLYFAKESDSRDLIVDTITEALPTINADQNFPSLVVSGSPSSAIEVTIGFADNRFCPSSCTGGEQRNSTGPTDVYIVRSISRRDSNNQFTFTFGDGLKVNNDSAGSALHGRPSVVVDDVGRAFLLWTDGRPPDPQAPPSPSQARAFFARVE